MVGDTTLAYGVAGASPPRTYRLRRAKPHPVQAEDDGSLESDASAPPEQLHTAKRIVDWLVAEWGYLGDEPIVPQYRPAVEAGAPA